MTLSDRLYILKTPTGAEVEVELKEGRFYGPARVRTISLSCAAAPARLRKPRL